MSIGLGFIGGAAVGLVFAWWNNELILDPNANSKDKTSDAIVNKEVIQTDGHKYIKTSRPEATSLFDWLSNPEDRA